MYEEQNIKQRLHTINQKGMWPKFMAYYAYMPLPILKKINQCPENLNPFCKGKILYNNI